MAVASTKPSFHQIESLSYMSPLPTFVLTFSSVSLDSCFLHIFVKLLGAIEGPFHLWSFIPALLKWAVLRARRGRAPAVEMVGVEGVGGVDRESEQRSDFEGVGLAGHMKDFRLCPTRNGMSPRISKQGSHITRSSFWN